MSTISNERALSVGGASEAENSTLQLDISVLKSASKVEGVVVTDALGQLTLSGSPEAPSKQFGVVQAIPQSQFSSLDEEDWAEYLKDKVDITANCELHEAKIIFIGETHTVEDHDFVASRILKHYANQTGSNLLLTEGTAVSSVHRIFQQVCFPNNRPSEVEIWDNKDHNLEHRKIIAGQRAIHALTSAQRESILEKRGSISLEEITKIGIKIDQLRDKGDALCAAEERIMRTRDNDLIDKVKSRAMDPDLRIFVIAGARHLIREGHKVMDHFSDVPSAVMRLKVER